MIRSCLQKAESLTNVFQSISLLFLRLILAYGFYTPAINKWSDMDSIVSWFENSLELPFPTLNAYMAAGTEAAGVVLLTLGLGTRFISAGLMIVMLVAIGTVHLSNGFSAGDNGFEIPLYFFLMLFVLFSHGAGKISLDRKLLG